MAEAVLQGIASVIILPFPLADTEAAKSHRVGSC
jgi:hypothetical protein